jgi:hypothetical protein
MGAATTSLNLENAKTVFAVANDSRFLFNRLRDDNTVRYLAQTTDPQKLVALINRMGGSPLSDLDQLATIYVHMVALASQDPGEVCAALKQLRTPNVPWGASIIAYIRDGASPVTYSSVSVPRNVPVATPSVSTSLGTSLVEIRPGCGS